MLTLPFDVERSIVIPRPASEVLRWLQDLNLWASWSPWLRLEPNCKLEISGAPGKPGHSQRWDGEFIGSGEMTFVTCAPQRIDYELEFLKPWKSRSHGSFQLEETPAGGGGQSPAGAGSSATSTKVTWTMKGTVPVFLFFLRGMMSSYVGHDFSRGLSMLKEVVETGDVTSRLEFKGAVEQKGFHFVGRARSCRMQDLATAMSEDFSFLRELVAKGELPPPAHSFSFTRKWDLKTGEAEYLAGLAFPNPVAPPTRGALESGQVADHRAYRVDHIGPYRFLGNAWAALMSRQRKANLKRAKGIAMYEIYRTTPDQVDEKDLITELYLPLRGS